LIPIYWDAVVKGKPKLGTVKIKLALSTGWVSEAVRTNIFPYLSLNEVSPKLLL
jgi:hypothetical protein